MGRPGFDQTIDNRLPYNIFLQRFPPEPAKMGFIFEISIFFRFLWASLPTWLQVSEHFLRQSRALRDVYLTCKFQLSMSHASGDIGRQSWSQKIWSKNEAEKTKSEKFKWHVNFFLNINLTKSWHSDRGPQWLPNIKSLHTRNSCNSF